MKPPTLAIIKTYDNAMQRMIAHTEKTKSSTEVQYHTNNRDAFAHIIREMTRVYGVGKID